ncbi:MAG: hypothetical protein WD824_02475 [Cyclobacteriaceae bacterium]
MLASKTELSDRYSQYSSDRLFDIIFQKEQYEPEAVEIAKEELLRRDINIEAALDDYLTEKENIKIRSEKTALIPLSFWEKLLFFILWMVPVFGAMKMNYEEDGMDRKLTQSKIFSRAGFCSLFLSVFLGIALELESYLSVALLWIFFFATTYLLERRITTPDTKES